MNEPNQVFAATFVDELAAAGLEAACIAPGSRSAPLAMALARHPAIRVYVQIDERSCSFFALGLAKASGRPVALLCTSGTAAAEFHPAVVEADHSRTPLVVLTAGRPPELIGVGANQAVEQSHLYGGAVRWFHDPGTPADSPGAVATWRRLAARAMAEACASPPGPVHLNLPFREPLTPLHGMAPAPEGEPGTGGRTAAGRRLPDAGMVDDLAAALRASRRPLLVAGEIREGEVLRDAVDRLSRIAFMPLLAEPSSQLRLRASTGLVEAYDALLRVPAWAGGQVPDLVVRLGAPPTSKPLNQWLAGHPCETFIVDPDSPWRDPDNLGTRMFTCDPAALLEAVAEQAHPRSDDWQQSWVQAGQAASAALEAAMAATPMFEAHAVRVLAGLLPEPAELLAGSSMPIRDVDTFWPAALPGQRFFGNRGASGIDGLVSTGLGIAAAGRAPATLLLGDLSLYHDMNGLWAIRRHGLRATVIVLDNNGGGIFSFLPQAEHADVFEELFGTPLDLDLLQVGHLYGLETCLVSSADQLPAALSAALHAPAPTMVVVRFSRQASVIGHRACWEAVAKALA
jgi:2-succinyl-5-enolpyruvyl-6-hydroxy-3-cyclohexene-1-carboxylate synthase